MPRSAAKSLSWLVSLPAFLPFLTAGVYARLTTVGKSFAPHGRWGSASRRWQRESHARRWDALAQRDFPTVLLASVRACTAHRNPAALYGVCRGRYACVLCGEPLWPAGRAHAEALLLACRCLRLPRDCPFPYAHAACADGLRLRPRGPCQFCCRFCGKTAGALAIRAYST